MQMPFRFKIGIHKWYLDQTGGTGYLCMLGLSFTFGLIVSLAQPEVEVERQNPLSKDSFINFCSLQKKKQKKKHINTDCLSAKFSKNFIRIKSRFLHSE